MGEGPAASTGPQLKLVCFELRGQELAFRIGDVRETLTLRPITHVFLTPPCLAGIFSLRGDIVPVLDLGVLLGLPPTAPGDDSRIVVVENGGNIAGVVVDRLRELRTLDDTLEPPPASLTPEIAGLMLGVAATPTGTVRVLDLDAILASDPVRSLASVSPAASEGASRSGEPAG